MVDADNFFPTMSAQAPQRESAPAEDNTAQVMFPAASEQTMESGSALVNGKPAEAVSGSRLTLSLPGEVAQLRSNDPDRVLYSPQKTYENAIPSDIFDPGSVENTLPPETQQAVIREYREMAADNGLSEAEVGQLHARILAQRENQMPDHEQQAQALAKLKEQFGDEADQALKDANLLLNRDPRVKRAIKAWGLGNDPETIVMVAQAARRELGKGRLSRKGR